MVTSNAFSRKQHELASLLSGKGNEHFDRPNGPFALQNDNSKGLPDQQAFLLVPKRAPKILRACSNS
jgi:hypothetical protein